VVARKTNNFKMRRWQCPNGQVLGFKLSVPAAGRWGMLPVMKTIPQRRFIKTLAAGAAAGCFGPRLLAAVAAKPRWQMKLSTSTIQYSTLPVEQACERIAALGFEAVDIWSAHENCPHLDDVAARLGADGLKQLLARAKLKLCAFSVYSGGYARYAQLLGKAGGGVAIQGSAPPCRPEELTAKMKVFLESLKPLADLAEQHNSWLAIENHGSALLNSLDSFKAFVDLNKSPRIGLALAPYHLQSIKASVEEAIGLCGSQLMFFYAWQNQPGIGQLPGHGPTDFAPWLKALAKINYRWHVNPFMHGHPEPAQMSDALAKARDYLREKAKAIE
jgi:sugar phosphate isomerase/epimerase